MSRALTLSCLTAIGLEHVPGPASKCALDVYATSRRLPTMVLDESFCTSRVCYIRFTLYLIQINAHYLC